MRRWSRLTTCLAIPASTVLLASTTGGGSTVARFLGTPGEASGIFASPSTRGDAFEPPVEIPASALDQANGARRFSLSSVLMSAYRAAVDGAPDSCHLSVPLLAAIGQVESGSLVGRQLDANHRLTSPILGPVLNGNGFAAVSDTDNGTLDGDTTWDRAMGPMQFIPSTWKTYGVDADGDGVTDPQDVDDATAAAAAYLCAGGRDLSTEDGVRAAVLSYNNSQAYYYLVLRWKTAFENASSLVVEEPDLGSYESVSTGAVPSGSVTPASLGFGSDSPASVAAPTKATVPARTAGSPMVPSPTAPASPSASPTPGVPSHTPSGTPTPSAPKGTPSGSPTGTPSAPTGTPSAPTGTPSTDKTPDESGKNSGDNETPDETDKTPGGTDETDDNGCPVVEDSEVDGSDGVTTTDVAPTEDSDVTTGDSEETGDEIVDPDDPCAVLDSEDDGTSADTATP